MTTTDRSAAIQFDHHYNNWRWGTRSREDFSKPSGNLTHLTREHELLATLDSTNKKIRIYKKTPDPNFLEGMYSHSYARDLFKRLSRRNQQGYEHITKDIHNNKEGLYWSHIWCRLRKKTCMIVPIARNIEHMCYRIIDDSLRCTWKWGRACENGMFFTRVRDCYSDFMLCARQDAGGAIERLELVKEIDMDRFLKDTFEEDLVQKLYPYLFREPNQWLPTLK